MKKAKKIIIGFLLVFIMTSAPFAYITVRNAMELDLFDDPFNDKKFNAEIWKQYHDSDDPDNPRGKMFADLKKHLLKSDPSKEGVRALLGEPDFRETETTLEYILGMWSGMRIDYDSITIEFNKTGQLTKVYRVQH